MGQSAYRRAIDRRERAGAQSGVGRPSGRWTLPASPIRHFGQQTPLEAHRSDMHCPRRSEHTDGPWRARPWRGRIEKNPGRCPPPGRHHRAPSGQQATSSAPPSDPGSLWCPPASRASATMHVDAAPPACHDRASKRTPSGGARVEGAWLGSGAAHLATRGRGERGRERGRALWRARRVGAGSDLRAASQASRRCRRHPSRWHRNHVWSSQDLAAPRDRGGRAR